MDRMLYSRIPSLLVAFSMSVAISASASATDQCTKATVEQARMAFHRTWFEEADALYSNLIRECPANPQNYAYAAIIDNLLFRDSAENTAAAESLLQNADRGSYSFERALTHFAKGELSRTESVLVEYLASSPGDSYAEHVLGFTLIDQGRPEDGASVLKRLIETDSGYFPARNHLAYALMMMGELDEAVLIAESFVEADPMNPSAWDTRASILDSAGRSEDALASLTRSILLDSRFAYGWSHMAEIFGAAGEWSLAERAYQAALDADSPYGPSFLDGEKLVDSAYDHFRAGETDESKRLAHKALAMGRVAEDTNVVGGALTAFCRLALREDDEPALSACSSELATLAHKSSEKKWRVYSIHMRAEFARKNNDLATADALYRESLELSEAIGLTGMVAAENFNRSFVSAARGDLDSATLQVREFFRVSAARNDGEPDAYGLIALANLLVAREELKSAATVIFAAERIFDNRKIIPDPADAAPFDTARQAIESQLPQSELRDARDSSISMTTQQLVDEYL